MLVLEFSASKGFLNVVPDVAEGAALLLNFGLGELPGEVDSVKVVLGNQPYRGVYEFVSRFRSLRLQIKLVCLIFALI